MTRTVTEQFEYLAGMLAGFLNCDVEHAENRLLEIMMREGGQAEMFARDRMGIK